MTGHKSHRVSCSTTNRRPCARVNRSSGYLVSRLVLFEYDNNMFSHRLMTSIFFFFFFFNRMSGYNGIRSSPSTRSCVFQTKTNRTVRSTFVPFETDGSDDEYRLATRLCPCVSNRRLDLKMYGYKVNPFKCVRS